MTGVKRTRRGVVVSFDEVEASLLRHLVGEVRDLLTDGEETLPTPTGRATGVPTDDELSAITGMNGPDPLADEPETPADPALARLLPDAYRDDPDAAGEFRRLMEGSLRRDKVTAAEKLLAALPGDGAGRCGWTRSRPSRGWPPSTTSGSRSAPGSRSARRWPSPIRTTRTRPRTWSTCG